MEQQEEGIEQPEATKNPEKRRHILRNLVLATLGVGALAVGGAYLAGKTGLINAAFPNITNSTDIPG